MMQSMHEIVTERVRNRQIAFKRCLAEGRYEVQRLLAVGGQGMQLIACDRRLANNRVLIKVPLYQSEELTVGRQAFLEKRKARHDALFNEIGTVPCLNEQVQNIPKLVDYFYDQNVALYGKYPLPGGLGSWEIKAGDDVARDLFIVYEFLSRGRVAAETLSQLIERRGRLREEFTLDMGRQILNVLWQFHDSTVYRTEAGEPAYYIYQDLKPDNILVLAERDCFLIDFGGLTRWVNGKTPDFNKVFTPGYAPTEAFETPNYLDHRFDIFSLGITMFECLTAISPVLGNAEEAPAIDYHLLDNIGLQPLTIGIIKKATKTNRYHRYRSAKEMLRDVDAAIGVRQCHWNQGES